MIDVQTADPNLECLDNGPVLDVCHFASDATYDDVIAARSSGDCANAAFIFIAPAP